MAPGMQHRRCPIEYSGSEPQASGEQGVGILLAPYYLKVKSTIAERLTIRTFVA